MTAADPPDTEIARRIAASFGKQAFMTTLGARLSHVGAGEVEIELPILPHLSQQHGFVHAGAVASIADSACGYAALTVMPAGAGDSLLAKGRVVKAGRTLTLALAEVFAIKGGTSKLCAMMTATCMTMAGRDGVSD